MKSRAAIYCRLSKEDIEKKESDYSESIKNQESMLIEYAKQHNFRIAKIYRDDDYSGLYADRPEFNKLIEDAKLGRFEIVIAKTQARFTRNIEHLERYLHHDFVEWGIRFIGVVDNVDTNVLGNKKARQINGLINEWYCEDLSANIKASFRIKQLRGEFIGSSAPYGYIKDPNNHHRLIPDDYAANVVRFIFSLYLAGMGKSKIARILTEEGVLRPAIYKRTQLKQNYYNPHERESDKCWVSQTVKWILENEVYIGNTIQNKAVKTSFKSKRKKTVDKKDWIRVENTHVPIIDKVTFDMAQEIKRKKSVPVKAIEKDDSIFARRLFCADCGKTMVRALTRSKNKPKERYYVCKTYKAHGNLTCTSHKIHEKVLIDIVLSAIHKEGERILQEEEIERIKSIEFKKVVSNIESELEHVNDELKKLNTYKEKLYESYIDNIVSKDEYLLLKKKYNDQIAFFKNKIEQLQKKKENSSDEQDLALIRWINKFKNHMSIDTLNKEVVSELIQRIEVHENKEVDILFYFHQ